MVKVIKNRPSQLTSSKTVQQRSDLALAYLICLCGYKNVTTVSKQEEIMADILLLLSEIKARAISSFQMFPESVEAIGYVPHGDNSNNEGSSSDTNNNDSNTQQQQILEIIFQEHLANKKYDSGRKLLSNASGSNIDMRSSYHIY